MQSIIELTAATESDGSIPIHKVIDKLNVLLDPKSELDCKFHLDSSTSRDAEQGTAMDLRTSKNFPSNSEAANKIRRFLITLQDHGVITFEEKQQMDTYRSTFIVTQADVQKLLQTANVIIFAPATQDTPPEAIEFTEIRTAGHHINAKYIKAHLLSDATAHLGRIESIITEHTDAIMTKEDESKLTPIALFFTNPDSKALGNIQANLKKLCNIRENEEGFTLWCNSSSEEYPIDLRILLQKDDARAYEIERKLAGLAVRHGAIIEIKQTDEHNAYIVKSVRSSAIADYLKSTVPTDVITDKNQIEEAIALLKKTYPANPLINDLILFDGNRLSSTRGYFHIRSEKFWPTYSLAEWIDPLFDLHKYKPTALDFDFRPADTKVEDKKPRYMRLGRMIEVNETSTMQLIIELKSLSELKEAIALESQKLEDKSYIKTPSA